MEETNKETENKIKNMETVVGMNVSSPSEKNPVKNDLGSVLVRVPQELEIEQSNSREEGTKIIATVKVTHENEHGEITLNEGQEAIVNVPEEMEKEVKKDNKERDERYEI